METKPIGPAAHGALDYGLTAMQLLAPSILTLKGPAKTLCYAFAGTQGLLNMLTDQPLALKPVVPFRTHGKLDAGFVPALLVLPLVTGALKEPKAKGLFISLFAMALTNFLLTDYKARDNGR